MDTRRLSTADTRLASKYDILEDHGSYLIANQKQTNARKLLYVIDLCDVKSEERKWAVIDYINEYKGLHLLPCMVRLGESFRDQDVFYVVQDVIKYGTVRDECLDSANNKVNASCILRRFLDVISLDVMFLDVRTTTLNVGTSRPKEQRYGAVGGVLCLQNRYKMK